MKKMVLAALIAVSVMALSQQQASAWVNARFGIGLNWHRQSGGNNFLWGAYRNGQVPGPEMFGAGGPGGGHPYAAPPSFAPQHHHEPQFYPPMPQEAHFPQHGAYQAPMSGPTMAPQSATPFQFANYPRPVYYYSAPTYYYYGR